MWDPSGNETTAAPPPVTVTLATSASPETADTVNNGVYFDVRSDGPAVTLAALTGGGLGHYREVTIWACEGSGAGKETERGAWRQVGAGTLKEKQSTRLALSSPVAVGAGATVGLLVHAAEGNVLFSEGGEAGEVDASDGAISVLKGKATGELEPFTHCYAGGEGFALAGAVEYVLTDALSRA